MYSSSQKTIKDPIELEGLGLHNGRNVNLCLKPAEVDSGIKFKRIDIDNANNVIATGGGAFTFERNYTILNNIGLTIWLNADKDTIVE